VTGKVVACRWEDAHVNNDEVPVGEITHRPWIYISVGILVKSDAGGITLAMDEGEDGNYRTRAFIPRAMVVDEWVVGSLAKKSPRKRVSATIKLEAE
jgi:hypothetical protein